MGTPFARALDEATRECREEDGLLLKAPSGLNQLNNARVSKARRALTDTVARTAIRCGLLILTWYFLSTALSIFNKKLVGKKHGIFGKGGFPAPLLLTGVQFAFQHLLARAVFAAGLMERTGSKLPWKDWCRLVLPNGTVTGLDIGFSNTSLVYITMSFYTMCKSTTPIFLLAFAFLWRLETPSWGLAGVVAVIVAGLLLLVHGEAEFNATGFTLVMSASCMSGLRFTLTQLLLHGHHGASSDHGATPFGGPLEVLEVLTPVMSVTTLLLSLATEQLWVSLPPSPYFNSWPHVGITTALIFVGAIIAFLMVWTEYQVIKETSALTFMIAGTVKEVVTVITSIAVFGDQFGLVNGIGLVVVIAGVLLFNAYKLRRLKASLRQQIMHSKDGGPGGALELSEQGVPIQLVAVGSAGSPLAAAAAASMAGGGDSFSGAGGLQQQRRRSGGSGAAPGGDEDEGGVALRTLEFEPLLPIGGVMVRR